MLKYFRILFLVVLVNVFMFGFAHSSVFWNEGTITDVNRAKSPRTLEVDGLEYRVSEDVAIYRIYKDRPGAFMEEPYKFYLLRRGQEVHYKLRDNLILKIKVLDY